MLDRMLGMLRDERGFALGRSLPPVCFGVGDITVALHVGDPKLAAETRQWYGPFACAPTPNAASVDYMTRAELPQAIVDWCVEEAPKYREVQVFTSQPWLLEGEIAIFRWDFRALISDAGRTVRALLLGHTRGTVDAVARIMMASELPRRRGILVHGASIERQGKGYLFLGVSGSGKSTIAALSECAVLNDEITLLSLGGDGRVCVHGTPFYGELARCENRGVAAAGVFLLHQSERTCVESLDPFAQRMAILRNTLTFRADRAGFEQVAAVVEALLAAGEVRRLCFEKNRRFLEVIGCS